MAKKSGPAIPVLSKRAVKTMQVAERREMAASAPKRPPAAQRTIDSFQNFQLNLGQGTRNALSASTYGFNPVTRIRTLLEWVHRGSWLGGIAIDLVADDMTRAGIDIQTKLDPKAMEKIQQGAVRRGIWGSLGESVKWARLYGGSLAFMMIDGQDPSTPLRIETVGKGQFRGLLPLDRWQVDPSLGKLVMEMGPHFGKPEFYKCINAPGIPQMNIHYSRVIRFVGVELPYNQCIMENMWGISVLERLWDRMVAFDSATTGASQLAYKSFLRVVKIKQLRELAAAGGKGFAAVQAQLNMMGVFQGIEGITLLDVEDEYEGSGTSGAGADISSILEQLAQQIGGALRVPLTRLFGTSPSGLGATGDNEMRTYYDDIKQDQERDMREGVHKVYRLIGQSEGCPLDDDFNFEFKSLWQMSDDQQSQVADRDTSSVLAAEERGLISPQLALKELRQRGRMSNRWSNITDEIIDAADEDAAGPPDGTAGLGEEGGEGKTKTPSKPTTKSNVIPFKKKKATKSADAAFALPLREVYGLPLLIECQKGAIRFPGGPPMPADYGYIRWTSSAEGVDEQMDCFVGDKPSDVVWVVDQFDTRTKQFDEHKTFFDCGDAMQDVLAVWNDAYNGSPMQVGNIRSTSVELLKTWLGAGNMREGFKEV